MNTYIDTLKKSDVNHTDIEDFKSKIKTTVEYICDDYDYTPNNSNGLIMAIQFAMFKTIVCDSEELDWDIKDTFNNFHSDFKNPKSSKAVGSVSVILGYSMSINFDEKNVNKDIRLLSGLIMKRNYEYN